MAKSILARDSTFQYIDIGGMQECKNGQTEHEFNWSVGDVET